MSPFVEIKVIHPEDPSRVNMHTVCGHQYEPILDGRNTISFDGSKGGCYCEDNGSLHVRACHLHEIERGCENIYGVVSRDLPVYKGGIICG